MKLISQAIVDFLAAKVDHPGRDLLDRYLQHGTDLETQVNVAAGNGEPVAGKRATWTDGVREWWNLRIPKNAYDEPEFKDYKLTWPLEEHAEAIGSTGWLWTRRASLWVGWDFDHVTGHAAGVGITEEELARVRMAAEALPYIEVRKSTGGKGIHLYCHLDEIPTANHTEHAALSRCIMGMMSAEVGFDFARSVDCAGGNMWLWRRNLGSQGLALIKPAERSLGIDDLPVNWRDHVEVVTRRRTKVRVNGISEVEQDPFDALASARQVVPLDDTHKDIIDALAASGYSTVWIQDHHLLQTHTCALKQVHRELGLRGFFLTNSPGTDKASPNCFLFPLHNGAWKVYRFGQGVMEDATWTQDGEGWTTCFYNHDPDFTTAARALGGAELADNKGYQFDAAKQALEVVRTLGQEITLDEKFHHRETIIRANKDGRMIARIKKEEDEAKPDAGWAKVRGGWWEKVLNVRTEQAADDLGAAEYDDRLRSLTTVQGEAVGWFIKINGEWDRRNTADCKMYLQCCGHSKTEAETILGDCIAKRWRLVNVPFGEEYTGNRQWNFNAPNYLYKSEVMKGDEQPKHPYWDRVLHHCFCDLDEEIKRLPWAQEANIRTGAQYGLAWIACCFRDPFEPLPFLFFFGNQNCGKSIFHEALSLLVTRGVVSAARSLTNGSGFNGELANAVLAYIEEENIAGSKYAYDRIKEWVTAKTIWIRRMRTDAYPQPNTLHFVMAANSQTHCPVFPGDTRITVIEVPDLLPEQEIPKSILQKHLIEEAPHFMHTLMNMELPKVQGRLRLPVIETYKKKLSEDLSRNSLELFIREQCHKAPGCKVLFSEFYERFREYLDISEKHDWSKIRVSRSLPSDTPCGAGNDNKRFIANLSFTPVEDADGVPLVCVEGRLRPKEG